MPEPATLLLVGGGLVGAGLARRRQHAAVSSNQPENPEVPRPPGAKADSMSADPAPGNGEQTKPKSIAAHL